MNVKNRFLVFATNDSYEPKYLVGAFSSFKKVLSLPRLYIRKKYEVVDVYDVRKEQVNSLWNGMDLSFLSKDNGGNREPKDAPATGSWSGWQEW